MIRKMLLTAALAAGIATQADAARIQTRGFGSSHFVVKPEIPSGSDQAAIDAEIARQQPNRRVEIVFRMPVE